MKVLKIVGYAVGIGVALIAVFGLTAYFVSNARLNQTFSITARAIAVPADTTAVQRGEHIAFTRGCVDCHGKDFGGAKVIEDGAMGRLYAPNLTRGHGSRTASFSDLDWVRAIRHGVGPDNHGLFIMPSEEYSHFSDEDLGCVIAYLKSVPPVDRERVSTSYGPVTRVLLTLGKMKLAAGTIDHAHLAPESVAKAANAEYGRYLSNGCVGCHGPNFSGGKIEIGPPDWPQARNLTPHPSGNLAKWTEADFIRTIRTARRPDGSELNPVMPRGFGGMDDTELKALYAFFKSLPPVGTGVR
jgi:mono/diheme cytochrome c family protein